MSSSKAPRQCTDITLTLNTIKDHLVTSLKQLHQSAYCQTVTKLESPVGYYAFTIAGITEKTAAEKLIKKVIDVKYIKKITDHGYGKIGIIINAEDIDRDTSAAAKQAYTDFRTYKNDYNSKSDSSSASSEQDGDNTDTHSKNRQSKSFSLIPNGNFSNIAATFLIHGIFISIVYYTINYFTQQQ